MLGEGEGRSQQREGASSLRSESSSAESGFIHLKSSPRLLDAGFEKASGTSALDLDAPGKWSPTREASRFRHPLPSLFRCRWRSEEKSSESAELPGQWLQKMSHSLLAWEPPTGFLLSSPALLLIFAQCFLFSLPDDWALFKLRKHLSYNE